MTGEGGEEEGTGKGDARETGAEDGEIEGTGDSGNLGLESTVDDLGGAVPKNGVVGIRGNVVDGLQGLFGGMIGPEEGKVGLLVGGFVCKNGGFLGGEEKGELGRKGGDVEEEEERRDAGDEGICATGTAGCKLLEEADNDGAAATTKGVELTVNELDS